MLAEAIGPAHRLTFMPTCRFVICVQTEWQIYRVVERRQFRHSGLHFRFGHVLAGRAAFACKLNSHFILHRAIGHERPDCTGELLGEAVQTRTTYRCDEQPVGAGDQSFMIAMTLDA